MSLQDPIADMLTRIRNANLAAMKSVSMPSSKLKASICEVLKGEGYINAYSVQEGTLPTLTIDLKYEDSGKPVIEVLKRISRPGLRTYEGTKALRKVRGGLGVAILTTAHGVMSDREARRQGLGGEVICEVF